MPLDIRVGELECTVRELRGQVAVLVGLLGSHNVTPRGPVKVPYVRFGAHNLPVPVYAKPRDSGMDLRADLTFFLRTTAARDAEGLPVLSRGAMWIGEDRIQLHHGARLTIGCGFGFETPEGKEWQVRPRSGGSVKGVDVTLGTADGGYRGEITMTVCNWTGWPLTINHGDKLSQIVLADVLTAELIEATELSKTVRGADRHGSTGIR